jgi:glycine/D-amino acid oxidase-like deaminating enzyme
VQSLGSKVALLSAEETSSRFPWLSTEGVVASSLGLEGEGWLDAYSLLQGFRKKAMSLGVKYVQDRVVGFELGSGVIEGHPQVQSIITEIYLQSGKKIKTLPTTVVLNSAGTGARVLMQQIQGKEETDRTFPIFPKKRCVFVFECEDKSITNSPLVIDTSGVYWRPEGVSHFISGVSPNEENDPTVGIDDFQVDFSLFNDVIWPALANRVPSFQSIRMTSAWAGHYDVNVFDHNALIGRHPKVGNFLVANGFSGHGLQQSPAVGRGLSELIVLGRYETLDLSVFELERIEKNRAIVEKNII